MQRSNVLTLRQGDTTR